MAAAADGLRLHRATPVGYLNTARWGGPLICLSVSDRSRPSNDHSLAKEGSKLDPEHGQLTDEFCIAEERGLLRSKRARAEPTKAYSEIQAEEDAERREASLQRAAAKRKALEDAERQRVQEKQRQTIALQHANRALMQQQRVNMPIVLPPAQPVATSVKPGARYPVKGETAVCPLCNGSSCTPY